LHRIAAQEVGGFLGRREAIGREGTYRAVREERREAGVKVKDVILIEAKKPQAERPTMPRDSSNSQSALQNSARENA